MGFFDDYEEDEQQPRRRKRGSANDGENDRLGWQDLVEELPGDEPGDEEPLDEEDDEMKELEVDDRGRIRNGGELDSSFWDEE